MKFGIITATALILSASSAMAGGFNGSHHSSAPQFANSSALNLAKQAAAIHGSKVSHLEQVAGATAKAINKANCGCVPAKQVANAHSKNVSIQVGKIDNYGGYISKLSQTAVSSATAKNVRGY
jgi:hypothetical protein